MNMNDFFRWIEPFDLFFLNKINQQWTSPRLDQLFIFLSEAHKIEAFLYYVVPAFLFLLAFKIRRRFFLFFLAFGIAVGIADALTYRVFKASVERPRPVDRAGLKLTVKQKTRPAGFSFPSNHASNAFAGAMVLGAFFIEFRLFVWIYAFLIAYSRVYVGAHYPSDVIAGALLGILVGGLICLLKTRFFGKERIQMDRG